MSNPFVAEIRMFAGNYPPRGWATCDGQLLPISQNTALFSLLGTQYGGNGQTTFGLPNLAGQAPLGQGQGPGLSPRFVGEAGGAATVSLLQAQMPAHSHGTLGDATVTAGSATPANNTWGKMAGRTPPPLYSNAAPNTAMHSQALSLTGGSAPHNNMPPYLALTFIIAMQGVYPPRQ
jgi:microcystin-dependent protein